MKPTRPTAKPSDAKPTEAKQPIARLYYARNEQQRVGAPLTCYESDPDNGGDAVYLIERDRLQEAVEAGARAIDEARKPKPFCRDCADFGPTCPGTGIPCDPSQAAMIYVLRSLGLVPPDAQPKGKEAK